jgi:hypothetical protein
MRLVTFWLAPVAFASAMACSSSGNKPSEDNSIVREVFDVTNPKLAVAMPREQPPLDATPMNFEGRLIHTPLPEEKSVEAYLGVEFSLRIANRSIVLSPSDTVTRDDLLAAKDTEVKLTCIMRRGAVPSDHESYPMEGDGSPMKRPDTCQVTTLSR